MFTSTLVALFQNYDGVPRVIDVHTTNDALNNLPTEHDQFYLELASVEAETLDEAMAALDAMIRERKALAWVLPWIEYSTRFALTAKARSQVGDVAALPPHWHGIVRCVRCATQLVFTERAVTLSPRGRLVVRCPVCPTIAIRGRTVVKRDVIINSSTLPLAAHQRLVAAASATKVSKKKE